MARISFTRKVATQSRQAFLDGIVRRKEDWRRPHLGASLIGHRCDRYLWLVFRWAMDPEHDGRQIRLFTRGHRAEEWVIEDLRAAGFRVHDREFGEQLLVSWGHFGGHLDGVVENVPEAPTTRHLLEVKSHNKKQFEKLVEKGLKSAKPEHHKQMLVYMTGKGLMRGLYVAVCKDNDEIYMERIDQDLEKGNELIERGVRLTVKTMEPPAKLDPENPPCVLVSKDGTRWPCSFFDLCHGTAKPDRNCRTCVESTPLENGTWSCRRFPLNSMTVEDQKAGCPSQLTIPSIYNAQVESIDIDKRTARYRFANGDVLEERMP